MISAQLGVSIEEVFVRLRARTFAAGVPLEGIARMVVSRLPRFGHGPGR